MTVACGMTHSLSQRHEGWLKRTLGRSIGDVSGCADVSSPQPGGIAEASNKTWMMANHVVGWVVHLP